MNCSWTSALTARGSAGARYSRRIPAVIDYGFRALNKRVVAGKALDDRAGCAAIIKALDGLRGTQLNVNSEAVFSVAEEDRPARRNNGNLSDPTHLALALEGRYCADAPGVPLARTSPFRSRSCHHRC